MAARPMAQSDSGEAKLSKREIVEILERNFELYKNESDFIAYVVELAIHLIQHQYDPEKVDPETAEEAQDAPGSPEQSAKSINSMQSAFAVKQERAHCPFCGTQVAKGVRCPTCGLQSG